MARKIKIKNTTITNQPTNQKILQLERKLAMHNATKVVGL